MKRGLLVLGVLLLGAPALAGTEEFSTFSVYSQQGDDENLLDRVLTRRSRESEREWERVPQGLSTSQGCLTSGTWVTDTRVRARAPLGRAARFELDVRDQQSNRLAIQYFDFTFRFATQFGAPGFLFRPFYDKSRQDLAVFWEAGDETAAAVARATFSFEDVFNDLWAFRQTQVGDASEPYERHPYEPALWVRVRRPRFGFEARGQWLTPSRKRFAYGSDTGLEPHATLWGGLGSASLETRVAGLELEAAGENRQALSRQTLPAALDYGGDFRRQWSAEAAARRGIGARTVAELRWIYEAATERSDPPYASRRLDTVDRLLQVEARRASGPWSFRVGALHDRIMVAKSGDPLDGYDTRIESRAYVGVGVRMGAATLDAVEGLELDPEPYDVWGVHDKAFLHFQTRF